jgi:hypothetical protein
MSAKSPNVIMNELNINYSYSLLKCDGQMVLLTFRNKHFETSNNVISKYMYFYKIIGTVLTPESKNKLVKHRQE